MTGVVCCDSSIAAYKKIHEAKQANWFTFKLSECGKKIIPAQEGGKSATEADFLNALKKIGAGYGMIDMEYTSKSGQKSKKVLFVYYCDENTPAKQKMLVAGSKEALSSKCKCQSEYQLTCTTEWNPEDIAKKLRQ